MLPIDSRKSSDEACDSQRQHQDQQTKCNHSRLTLNKRAGISPHRSSLSLYRLAGQIPTQIVCQVLRRRIALLRQFFKTFKHDCFQVFADPPTQREN